MGTKDQVAQLIVGEAKARNHTRDECLAEMSALYQESQWDETVWDRTHVTYGVAQQDGSYAHRFEGAAAQVKAFFDKLDVKRASPGHGDIWLNICWLQQAPNWSSAQYWYDHGRRAYLTEIKSRIATVTPYLDKYWPTTGGTAMPAAPPFKELDFMTGGGRSNRSRPPINFLIHTEEGNSSAENLARYCNGSHDVSYHYTVRDGIVCDVVDTDYASWSVLDANAYTINLCFAGSRAAWSRDEWLQRDGDIRIAAWLAVQDCRKYKIPTTVIAPPYGAPRPGISDHKYVTQALHIGTHTDVGNNFPWDVFTRYINEYDGTGAPAPAPAIPAAPVILDRAGGTPDDQLLYRWNCLGGLTPVEALAQVRDKVCGTNDAGKPGVKTL
jgi:hypothetical protein